MIPTAKEAQFDTVRFWARNETAGRIRIPPGSRCYPLATLRPVSRPAMARGEASHAGTASVLGSDEPHVRPACSAIIAAVTRRYVTPIIEQAAHRQANECFAGPQTALSATPTHTL